MRSKSKSLQFLPFLQGIRTVVQIHKWKLLVPPDPDQPVYLVWEASEETHLFKPLLVHAHQTVSET